MRIITISDKHNKHAQIPIEYFRPCDLIIHAGDFTSVGHYHEVERFVNWFETLPAKHKVVIPGNHELTFDHKSSEYSDSEYNRITELFERKKASGIHLLINSSIRLFGESEFTGEIYDIKIFGTPNTPRFRDWAFNSDPGEIAAILECETDIDILISHGPPYAHLDTVEMNPFDRLGSKELLQYLERGVSDTRKSPLLNVFGHIHTGRGVRYATIGIPTNMINTSVLNEQYRLQYPPYCLDANFAERTIKLIDPYETIDL